MNDTVRQLRQPAPALLNDREPTPDSFVLCLDPLGTPAPSVKPTYDPPPMKFEMTDDQLKAALDRWGESEEPPPPPSSSTIPLSTPLLPPSPTAVVGGAVACLCSATLGAGILALPYAMAQAGILCGMAMLLASAAATALSIRLLVQAMQVVRSTNHHHHAVLSYEDLVQHCLGTALRRLAAATMLVFCGGGAVAYVIAVGDILQQSGWTLFSHRSLAMTLAWATAMVPLSMLRTMKSLECTSSIGIASVATLVLAALYHYLEHPGQQAPQYLEDGSQSILAPTQGILSILRACPIILFAFSCQVNVCAIYDEMPGHPLLLHGTEVTPNQDTSSLACFKYRRMTRVTWCAVAICTLLYSSISIIALLDFGSTKMTPNILTSYSPESVMQVAFIGMAMAVILAYPMNIFPARGALLGIVRACYCRQRQQSTGSHDDLQVPLLPLPGGSIHSTVSVEEARDLSEVCESASVSVTQTEHRTAVGVLEHVLATLFLTGLSLALALVAPNISVVFGLLGGTSSSVLGFVLPGLLGYKTADEFYRVGGETTTDSSRRASGRTKILSLMLVVAGILIGIVTTAVTVYSTFLPSLTNQ